MDLQRAADTADSIATVAAIVVGGIWTYLKFIRGRTFAHRAELSVTASLEVSEGITYLNTQITLRNTGLSRIPLNSKMKVIRVYGDLRESDNVQKGMVNWQRIKTIPIFDQHDWVEAQEPIADSTVCILPSNGEIQGQHTAYRIDAVVGAQRRLITRKGIRWQARTLLFKDSK